MSLAVPPSASSPSPMAMLSWAFVRLASLARSCSLSLQLPRFICLVYVFQEQFSRIASQIPSRISYVPGIWITVSFSTPPQSSSPNVLSRLSAIPWLTHTAHNELQVLRYTILMRSCVFFNVLSEALPTREGSLCSHLPSLNCRKRSRGKSIIASINLRHEPDAH